MDAPFIDREYPRPPEEFPPPAAQTTPPPPEFGSGGLSAPPRKKKRKYHWLAAAVAAGLLSTVALFSDGEKAIVEIVEPLASPTPIIAAAATAAPTLDHTPSPSPVPTKASAPTPDPTPSPKSTPEPEIAPDAELIFYRTSEVYHLQIMLKAMDKITAVTARMIDRGNQETIWEHVFSEEEIRFGWYALSNYDLYAGEYVKNHMDQVRQGYEPDPFLEVVYTARTDDGAEETVTKQAEAAYELWISARYDLKDPSQDFLSYFLEETTYPDCFVVRIDPSPYGNLRMILGEDAELQPGDVAVTLTVNGQSVPADDCRVEKGEIVYPEGTLYTYALVMPRPDSFPEQGTAEIRITRKLIHYPSHTSTDIRNIEY